MIEADSAKVMPEPTSGCWIWIGARNDQGYGQTWDGARVLYAHRVAYQQRRGTIPDGYEIDHLCRNRACVNWRHLEAVTSKVNKHRGTAPTILIALSGRCRQGHDLAQAYVRRDGKGRKCRACNAARQRRYNAERRIA